MCLDDQILDREKCRSGWISYFEMYKYIIWKAHFVPDNVNACLTNSDKMLSVLGWMHYNSIAAEQMRLYSNRVLSCCSTQIVKTQSLTLWFPFSYWTVSLSSNWNKQKKKKPTMSSNNLISDKLLNSPNLMILSASHECLIASECGSIHIWRVLLTLPVNYY